MPEATARHATGLTGRALLSLLLLALAAASWSGRLDQLALSSTDVTLTRALTTFAVSRGLNGVISLAQGTEIAIQPVGVGVTLSVGEILDPLNDLVERFSWLVMVACASLGTQMLLAQILANVWVNALLSAAVAGCLVALWWPARRRSGGAAEPAAGIPVRATLLRLCILTVFGRFLFVAVTLTTAWVDSAVLAQRQEAALAELEDARDGIEALQSQSPDLQLPEAAAQRDPSMLERLEAFIDEQRQALNVENRLKRLSERAEEAVSELLNLIVIFIVQTILVPVASLLVAARIFRWLWRASFPPRRSPQLPPYQG
ncbi:MAG: hypothetical protein R3E86_10200 [Pseudomonadales bacterium]